MANTSCRIQLPAAVILAFALSAFAAQPGPAGLRSQTFDSDPHWESFRSHLKPDPPHITRQDFGVRDGTHFSEKPAVEIGGWIQRSATPAYLAVAIPEKTLADTLSASGQFAVTKSQAGSGMLFGWFNQTSRGWRTPNSFAFRIDGEKDSFRVFFEYGTRHWLTGGGGCFEGEHYQTTSTKPFPADGSAHTWALQYDPNGHGGDGLIAFTLDGKRYERALAPGHKSDGATFDRFGMFNQHSSGNGMEVYFGNLVALPDVLPLLRETSPKATSPHSETKRTNSDETLPPILPLPKGEGRLAAPESHGGGGEGQLPVRPPPTPDQPRFRIAEDGQTILPLPKGEGRGEGEGTSQPTDVHNWQFHGNKAEFTERYVRPFHDFGFSPTSHAGAKPGELGGIIWRDEKPACYGDKVGPLTLNDELFISGKFVFFAAGSDSAACIGWYDSASKTNQPYSRSQGSAKNYLGIIVEGPSRIGHYFRPAYRTSSGTGQAAGTGPVIRPDGKPHDFSLHYSSSEIVVTLDQEKVTLPVPRSHRDTGATFDRFGLFNFQEGGIFVEIYLDDLQYTARR